MIKNKKNLAAAWLLTLAAIAGFASGAMAQQPAAEDPAKIFEDAKKAAQAGPQDVPLAGQATLHLPAGKIFIPQPQAGKMLRAMGNPGEHTELQGLVFPQDGNGWFATLHYEASGYIKDNDAKEWNADDMLKSLREGTEDDNAEREKMGVTPMEIVGWAEKPSYSADTHRLVWAMSSRDKGAPGDAEQGVNYNTYALGREGYISLNLVTDLKELAHYKGEAQGLLGALEFQDGKRYADFNASTDHVAEYGLAALVLGVGAKKLGLLAVAFAFLAKFAKIIILAVVGFGGVFAKFFGRKKSRPG